MSQVVPAPTPCDSDEAPADPVAYQLLLDEALRSLTVQSASLDELRARAGTLLSAASLVAAFLGNAVLTSGKPLNGWAWAGVVLFAVVAVLLIAILLPIYKWSLETDTRVLLSGYVEGPNQATLAVIRKSLACYFNQARLANRILLKRLDRVFTAAAVLLLIETGGLLVALWSVHQ